MEAVSPTLVAYADHDDAAAMWTRQTDGACTDACEEAIGFRECLNAHNHYLLEGMSRPLHCYGQWKSIVI